MILSNFVDLIFIAIQLNPPLSVREAFSFLVGSNYKHTLLFCKQCSVAQHTGCSSPEHSPIEGSISGLVMWTKFSQI